MSDAAAETATTETTESTETTTTSATTETVEEQLAKANAEAEKWKNLSKKNEDRAKANSTAAKELDELRATTMSDAEKLVDQAKKDTRAEVTREFGSKLVDAEVRAAAKDRVADVDALLEGLDRSKFLDDAGDPDRDAITAWVDRIAPKDDETTTTTQQDPFFDLGQGTRSSGSDALNGDPLLAGIRSKLGIG